MSVKYRFEHPLDAVLNLLKDESFRTRRSEALNEQMLDCRVAESGKGFAVTMDRIVHRELPSVLAKVFSARQQLVFREEWLPDGKGWAGKLSIDIKGQPVEVSANFSLKQSDGGCVYEIEHRSKAKIPLIGGKVEKYINSQTDDGAVEELEFLSATLDRG